MADSLHSVLSTFGVGFDAAIAREEEDAAADLAMSLLQERDYRDVLARGGPWTVVLQGDHKVGVEVVAADFLVAGPFLVPIDRAVVAPAEGGPRPRASRAALREVLRSCARAATEMTVRTPRDERRGRLIVCGKDYLRLRTTGGDALLPRAVVAWVRLEGDGNAGC